MIVDVQVSSRERPKSVCYLQNATDMVVERIGVAVDKPDADDWWKGDGDE